MLVAELRRKLVSLDDIDPKAPDVVDQLRQVLKESREDLLTADVFGALKYLPRRPYLEAVLRLVQERNPHGSEFAAHLPTLLQELEQTEFQFWPCYATPHALARGETEPDVVLTTASTFVVIEAKLGSGFGEGQIERELCVALDQAGTRQAFLLLVTTSAGRPKLGRVPRRAPVATYFDDRVASGNLTPELATELKSQASRLLWIDWSSVLQALDDARVASRSVDAKQNIRAFDLLDDLVAVAAQRRIWLFKGVAGLVVPDTHLSARARLLPWIVDVDGRDEYAMAGWSLMIRRELVGSRWRLLGKDGSGDWSIARHVTRTRLGDRSPFRLVEEVDQ